MHRFFAPFQGKIGETVVMNPEDASHCLRVLRLGTGSVVQVVSPPKTALAVIISTENNVVELRIKELLPDTEPLTKVTLYQGLPKSDKLEWIVQKGTELGCSRFVPVAMTRSIAQSEGKDALKKAERLTKISKEAVKQCGRSAVPEVHPPAKFSKVLPLMEQEDVLLIPWEEEKTESLHDVLHDMIPGSRIGIVIGPEGGITPQEIDEMHTLGNARTVSLGPRILRTETAALAVLAITMAAMGEMTLPKS